MPTLQTYQERIRDEAKMPKPAPELLRNPQLRWEKENLSAGQLLALYSINLALMEDWQEESH